MIAVDIAVAHTTIDTGYTRFLTETAVPSKTVAQDENDAQPKIDVLAEKEAHPGTKSWTGNALVPVQYLLSP